MRADRHLVRLAAWLLVAIALAGCSGAGDIAFVPPGVHPADEDPVRFLAFGDYGFGSPSQNATARGMEAVCARKGCDLALLLGDNIYPNGPTGPDDPAFERVFEVPYRNLSIPFYVALGNHDVRGENPGGADSGDFLVDRSELSPKWRMPARSHAFRVGDVYFASLDLTSFYRDHDPSPASEAVGTWIEEQKATDAFRTARWRVAFAHFPYASNGIHGNAGTYDGHAGDGAAVRALLEEHVCGAFDLYLAGHDHSLEWLAPQPRCLGTELVVSGAAAEARELRQRVPTLFQEDDQTGFFWFEARDGRIVGRAYSGDGYVLFEREVIPRSAAGSSTPPPPDARS